MESNNIRSLLSEVEKGESHHHGVQPDVVNNTNKFDELLKFDKYIRSSLPSLRLSLPTTPTFETDVDATIVATDSLSLNESTTWGCPKSEKLALGHAHSLSFDSIFLVGANDGKKFSGKEGEESNMKLHFRKSNSVPEKLDELTILVDGKSADKSNERKMIGANELKEKIKNLASALSS